LSIDIWGKVGMEVRVVGKLLEQGMVLPVDKEE
jgi:hypothetical protein